MRNIRYWVLKGTESTQKLKFCTDSPIKGTESTQKLKFCTIYKMSGKLLLEPQSKIRLVCRAIIMVILVGREILIESRENETYFCIESGGRISKGREEYIAAYY
ncbi:hypothetical protein MASR2M70_03830 [Bacillota bacterium]